MKEFNDFSHIFGVEKIVIIVPLEWKSMSITSFMSVVNSPLFKVWIVAILGVTLLRMWLQKCIHRKSRPLIDLFFETFGSTFGSVSGRLIDNRPERILMLFLLFGAVLADILCTGILFEQFSTKQLTPTINSLADLMDAKNYNSHQTLCIPKLLTFEQIQQIFHQRFTEIILISEADILFQIYNGNISCIYLLSELKALRLLSNKDMENKAKLFHIIPNTYLCMCENISEQFRITNSFIYVFRWHSIFMDCSSVSIYILFN